MMISSQHHPYPSNHAESYHHTDSTSVTEEPHPQDYHPEQQNNNRSTMLLHGMREQIEFYFSINNYTRDVFLQQVVTTHQGSVPITVIAQFPKIQQLYHGMMQHYYTNNPTFVAPIEVMVCRSLAPSRLIDVSNDGYYLRPNWMLLQDHRDVTASHSQHVPSTDNSFHHDHGPLQVVKLNGMNHTDATNTTVSPTSFASGSDGSVGPPSMGGEAAVLTAKLPPPPAAAPVMFNPTGGVYYVPQPPNPAYHPYPVFAAPTTYQPYHHPPAVGVVAAAATSMSQSYPMATSYYRPHLEANGPFYVPQPHQCAPPPPQPYPYYNSPPPPPFHHGMTYLDVPMMNEQYAKVPLPLDFPVNTENSNQRSMPSLASLNAPPAVIRLQDPFHVDSTNSQTFPKHQQGGQKKNKGRLRRQSSSDHSNRNELAGRSSQQGDNQSTNMDTSVRYTTETNAATASISTKANHKKTDDATSIDGNSRNGVSISQKEKNRVPGSHPNRTTSRSQPPNRTSPTSSLPSRSNRGNRNGTKNRSNANHKVSRPVVKKEANILIDENFPCLTTGFNPPAVGKPDYKPTLVEDSNKKKYAEALLHNPGISNVVSTQSSMVHTSAASSAIEATVSAVAGDVHSEIPAVTNLLDKFNLHT